MKKSILFIIAICSLVAATAAIAAIPETAAPQESPLTDQLTSPPGAASNSPAANEAPKVCTVQQLYQEGTKLHGHRVTVHGKIVKVLAGGIMGKVWSHLQDGTGEKEKGNNDIIIVTAVKSAEKDDEVTVTGTVAVHSGAGAKVMVVDATISK